jgi:thiamine biosynthesis lipoprotein
MRQFTETRFHALGTEVLVIAADAASLGPALYARVHQYELRFSRFLAGSELQRLCAASGAEVAVSEDMFQVLTLTARFHRETGGVFDPLIRPDLEAAGYDRTFAAVAKEAPESPSKPRPGRATFASVHLDGQRRTVQLPEGAAIDLGGIAKGWILDRLGESLGRPFLVDIGGDMVARGSGPGGGPGWLVSVADPYFPERDLRWLRLDACAIATSTTMRRRWRRGGRWLHHLIDPRTGAPAETDVAQATVVAPSAVEADVFAKTALLLGSRAGRAWLERRHLPGLLVTGDGAITTRWWSPLEVAMTGQQREALHV